MDIKVDEALWASSMLPEGVVERWFQQDGEIVMAGDVVAEISLEGAIHKITAPAAGRLAIVTGVNSIIEPGAVLGRVK
jgi:pyruvate/2-oxoglutarate dehydrogenase complex dihydrolipoamide acyltransferase (E2) component